MKSCTQSATATQQEPESEVNSEALNKSAQPAPTVQQSPPEAKAGQNDKDPSPDKNKENVTVEAGVTSHQPIKLVQVQAPSAT